MTDSRSVTSEAGLGDIWSEWLLYRRHGGDPDFDVAIKEDLKEWADRVLDLLPLRPDTTLADIGAGDGLIAFRAIERAGPALRVILTDISPSLLDHAQMVAIQRQVRDQCRFIQCAADDLEPLADASIDALCTRAVLAYVHDKPKALREFYRVLKPGGRISLAEPIMQDEAFAVRALRLFIERQPADTLNPFMRLLHRWRAAQFPDSDEGIRNFPLTSFSERDLIRHAHTAGFSKLHLEFHIDMEPPAAVPSWETFLRTSPHPLAPPTGVILQEQFSADERKEFERVVRTVLADREALSTSRMAYLTATKRR
ncbi:MAG: class I SAM-dependent methyltransferase [Steroidobacteraceae bacterium]